MDANLLLSSFFFVPDVRSQNPFTASGVAIAELRYLATGVDMFYAPWSTFVLVVTLL